MISKEKAISAFEGAFKNKKVVKIGNYKNSYLIVAPNKDLGEENDTNDPYFLMNKETGDVELFNPLSDMTGFRNAFK